MVDVLTHKIRAEVVAEKVSSRQRTGLFEGKMSDSKNMHKTKQDDTGYLRFCTFLKDSSGIILGENKHYLVNSRLSTIVREWQVDTLNDLLDQIEADRSSHKREMVIEAMTTNETYWFRDDQPFEIITKQILPDVAKNSPSQPIKAWSAACSSGQEAYSLSMVFEEALNSSLKFFSRGLEVIATDISQRVLQKAMTGKYERLALSRGLSEIRKQQFFLQIDDENWQVKDKIRQRVSFRTLNLLDNYSALSKVDLILCRNVLIYFSVAQKENILIRLAQRLNPQGYLILGASESIAGLNHVYDMVRCNPGIVYQLKK